MLSGADRWSRLSSGNGPVLIGLWAECACDWLD